MNLTGFCIKRPVTTCMFFAALFLLGLISASKLKMDLFPQVDIPSINVSVSYSGAGPQEIEQMITIPLEQALSTVNGVQNITSNSREGSSRVTVHFPWGYNLETATNDIRTNLDRLRNRLPDGAGEPSIRKYDPSSSPILSLGVSGETDEYSLRLFAEEDLANLLQKAEGVASVDVMGGKRREIQVLLHRDRLQALGVTGDQVVSALRNENIMMPAGRMASGAADLLLRTQGEFSSIEDIRNLVITVRNGVPVQLKSLATVEEGNQDENSIVRIDGIPGIVVSIRKRSDANTVQVADAVYKAIKEAEERFPEYHIRVLNDSSSYIRSALNSVANSALAGAVLAALILLVFLHNVRMTVIVSVVMPISIVTTLILAYFARMTLNTISLGGLALGVGMLVDNSVVVLDNIYRHHHKKSDDVALAALEGTVEMGPALMASTLTTVCVFFPLIFLTGRSAIIFSELSYMVIFSLLCSLLVAVTLIPTLCSKFLKSKDLDDNGDMNGFHGIKSFLISLQESWTEAYAGALAWALRNKKKVLLASLIIFLTSLPLFMLVGTELVQATDEGIISISIQLPSGTQLDETARQVEQIVSKIRALVPEIQHEELTIGGRWGQGSESNEAFMTLRLVDKGKRKRSTSDIAYLLQSQIRIPGARVRIFAPNSMRRLYGGSDNSVEVDVRGYDLALSKQVAHLIMDKLEQIPGITNTSISREEEQPELLIRIDRARAADLGITAAQIANAIQTYIDGKVATVLRKDGREYQVRVKLRDADKTSRQDLNYLTIAGRNGRVAPLSNLVTLVPAAGKVSIERQNQERVTSVRANVSRRDLGSVIRDVKSEISKIKLPEGISLAIGGDYEEQQRSFRELFVAIILALLLVYMVMASQFESFLDPFVIMFSVPFSLSGVALMLFLTDTAFNTQVYIGLIMLGGIVVNNAIVLISYFRILMDKGLSLEEAVIEGGKFRLRPILMTTCTTALALIPLALGLGEGAETQTPLARTVIGGLTFSTAITLFLIPTVFVIVEIIRERWKTARKKIRPAFFSILLLACLASVIPSAEAAQPEDSPLTVEQAVKLALTQGPAGKILDCRRETAQSRYRENISGKSLEVLGDLSATKTGDKTSHEIGANVKDIYLNNLLGLKSLATQIYGIDLNIALLGVELSRQQLVYQVIETYYKAVLAIKDLALARDNLARITSLQEETAARAKAGLTSIVDTMGVEAQLSDARNKVRLGENTARVAMIRLKRLLGLADDAPLELAPFPEQPLDVSLEELTRQALANRPEVQTAEENLKRAEKTLRLAQLAGRIGINVSWSIKHDDFRTSVSLSNQNNSGTSDEWHLGINSTWYSNPPDKPGELRLTFSLPLFDSGRRREKIQQARLSVTQLKEELTKLRDEVRLEVEEAYYQCLGQQDAVKNSELQAAYQTTNFDATQAKMRIGLSSIKEVLDAQTLLNQAQTGKERAYADLYLAGIKLMKATGTLFRENEENEVEKKER